VRMVSRPGGHDELISEAISNKTPCGTESQTGRSLAA
jgi:hypothetical protein